MHTREGICWWGSVLLRVYNNCHSNYLLMIDLRDMIDGLGLGYESELIDIHYKLPSMDLGSTGTGAASSAIFSKSGVRVRPKYLYKILKIHFM